MTVDVSRFLPAIYDAALSDVFWQPALDTFTHTIGAVGAILVAIDQVGQPFRIEQASSIYTPDIIKFYFETYGHHDEPIMSQRLAATAPLMLLRDCDVWGDMSLLEDRPDYRWIKERFGIRRRAGVRLSTTAAWHDLLALQFDREWSPKPHALQRKLDKLLPHMAKVIEINRQFSILRAHYQAALAALDHVRIGMCIVEHRGHVIISNTEARRVFALADGLTVSRTGLITAAASAATAELTRKIRLVTSTARGEGNDHELLLSAERPSGKRPFMIEIAPLRDSAGELENGLEGAIVFIVDPSNHAAISTERMAHFFGLTAAEAEICRQMVTGLSAAEIAEIRCVSPETAKSQIKAVYAKTNTRRRADLVRLALAIEPPIRSPLHRSDHSHEASGATS